MRVRQMLASLISQHFVQDICQLHQWFADKVQASTGFELTDDRCKS